MGEDPGSLLPEQTRLRGIDIPPRDTQENALARPVLTHPMYFAPTRVMSPSTMMGALGTEQAILENEINTSLLVGQHLCQVCSTIGPDMSVCAECGMIGHPVCMKMSPLEGYWFCCNWQFVASDECSPCAQRRLAHVSLGESRDII